MKLLTRDENKTENIEISRSIQFLYKVVKIFSLKIELLFEDIQKNIQKSHQLV